MIELARFAVVFEGVMWQPLRGVWVQSRITELTDEVGLTQTVLGFQNRDHYIGKVVEIERLYSRV